MGEAVHVSPAMNTLLTTLFMLEIAAIFATLGFGTLPPSTPLDGKTAMVAQGLYCFGLLAVIYLVKYCTALIFRPLSRTIFAGDPLSKPKTMHKLQDQMWQLFIHVTMTLLEYYVMHVESGKTESWVLNYWDLWQPHPENGQTTKASVHFIYFLQMGIWIDTDVLQARLMARCMCYSCMLHRFVEERHKDYILMYTHHLVTIALLYTSYYYNYMRIGVIVLYLHDVSDILVDLLKIFNYCQLEGMRGLFLVETAFISNFATWGYYRLYYLFWHVIVHGVLIGAREVGTAPGVKGMESFSKAANSDYTRGHMKGGTFGDGSFNVWENLWQLPTHPNLKFYWSAASLLCALQIMHVIWYMMFWRLLYRMLFSSENPHDAGREVYEGESDDEKKND